ncbi:ThiF family adenylyltransferase [Nonomuraea lactucae]|uniref:ThiF family adenylyltransferase n=1 Tax=Nonomuraea lactucae TaxID=2249762 RepID=UPI0013B3A340|nr:ThiF family adenylyltransferase [Nonomuraea lactucae]
MKPALRRILRDDQTLQLGVHPARAILLTGLTRSVRQWIDGLDGTRDLGQVLRAAPAAGLDEPMARALLDRLAARGLLHDAAAGPGPLRGMSLAERDRLEPDLDALDLASAVPDGGLATLRVRRQARVRVYGAARVGAQIVTLLASCGVGEIRVIDPDPVRPRDLTPGGLTWQEMGLTRQDAAVTAALRHTSGGPKTPPTTPTAPSTAVEREPVSMPATTSLCPRPRTGKGTTTTSTGTRTGANPRTANGADPRTANGADPRSANGADPRSANGADPRSANGADPRSANGADPRSANGADPRSANGADPRTANGADPRTANGADPRAATGIGNSTGTPVSRVPTGSPNASRGAPGSPNITRGVPGTPSTTGTSSASRGVPGTPSTTGVSTGTQSASRGAPGTPSASRGIPGTPSRPRVSTDTQSSTRGAPRTGGRSVRAEKSEARPQSRQPVVSPPAPPGTPSVRVSAGAPYLGDGSQRPDLVILAPVAPLDRVLVNELNELGIPHLLASAFEGHGSVGPLVLPGRTACLHCVDLARRDTDPAWPVVAARLGGYPPGEIACDTTMATLVAAAAVGHALAFLDGRGSTVTNGTSEVMPDWRWRSNSWPPHPECRCMRNNPCSLTMVVSPTGD